MTVILPILTPRVQDSPDLQWKSLDIKSLPIVQQVIKNHGIQHQLSQIAACRSSYNCEVLEVNRVPVGAFCYETKHQTSDFNVSFMQMTCDNDRLKNICTKAFVDRVVDKAKECCARSIYIQGVLTKDTKYVELLTRCGFVVDIHTPFNSICATNKYKKDLQPIVASATRLQSNSSQADLKNGCLKPSKVVKKSRREKKPRKSDHHLLMRKVYIHQIRDGSKTVEGRIFRRSVINYRKGDTVRFYYLSNNADDVKCRITAINRFKSFKEMLQHFGFKKCIPDAESFEMAVSAYDAIPNYSQQADIFGVIGIALEVIPPINKNE